MGRFPDWPDLPEGPVDRIGNNRPVPTISGSRSGCRREGVGTRPNRMDSSWDETEPEVGYRSSRSFGSVPFQKQAEE